MSRGTTLLNRQGDVTIVWTEEQDELVLPVIEAKMAEGFVFFLIEPRLGGLAPPSRTQLADTKDTLKHRAIAVADKDFGKLVGLGQVQAISTPAKDVKTVRRAKTAKEVVTGESVAVRPARGG